MKFKKIVAICLLAYSGGTALIIILGMFVLPAKPFSSARTSLNNPTTQSAQDSATQPTDLNAAPAVPDQTSSQSTNSTASSAPSSVPTSGIGSNTSPSPPIPTPTCGVAGGTCTSAQVASHNTAGNCWMIYNGGYYIVTSYVNQHPGGSSVFNSQTCGHDVTGYMNGSQSTAGQNRRHSNSAYTILQSYYVGRVSG